MAARKWWMLAVVVALSGMSLAQPAKEKDPARGSDREKLVGAWHLVSMGDSGASRQTNLAKIVARIQGTLIYTRDGHMSVQLMYPPSAASLSNEYVRNGYEASFGSYDVNEETHDYPSRGGIDYAGTCGEGHSAQVSVFRRAADHSIGSTR